MPRYEVKQGDCISSIACAFGFVPDTVWDHPENAGLKAERDDLHVLFPGDVVFVPDKEVRVEARPTDGRHTFVRKGVPEYVSVRFLHEQEPCAGEDYLVSVDGRMGPSGKLDSTGGCTFPVLPGSKIAKVTLGDPTTGETYRLLLGHLDPVEETSGVEWRLWNLGYLETLSGNEENPDFIEAVKAFQVDYDLATNGLDDETRQKLKDVHGS